MTKTNNEINYIIDLPQMIDDRGSLSWIEMQRHIPFDITSVDWISGMKEGEHIERCSSKQMVIVPLVGYFDIVLDGDSGTEKYTLNKVYSVLYLTDATSFTFENVSSDSVCLILSSNEKNALRSLKEMNISRNDEFEISSLKTIDDCLLMKLPVENCCPEKVVTINNGEDIPFCIKRIFYIYDIPQVAVRGMHAHKYCHEILVAVNGYFDVELNDGVNKRTVTLDGLNNGLYIPPGIWASQRKYSPDAVCLALASDKYDSDDYINEYSDFLKYRQDANRNI